MTAITAPHAPERPAAGYLRPILGLLATAIAAAREAEALTATNDAGLEARGLSRNGIGAHLFRKYFQS